MKRLVSRDQSHIDAVGLRSRPGLNPNYHPLVWILNENRFPSIPQQIICICIVCVCACVCVCSYVCASMYMCMCMCMCMCVFVTRLLLLLLWLLLLLALLHSQLQVLKLPPHDRVHL